jgi:sodium/potassium-transporting ATPase subunit alpha
METTASAAKSYWYAGRKGLLFSALWFGFGTVPADMAPDRFYGTLSVASSVHFVCIVVINGVDD